MSKNKILISSLLLSIIAELFLVFIIYFNPAKLPAIYDTDLQSWVSATMNGLSAICLYLAWIFIRNEDRTKHILFIHFALLFSSLFLINYIFYHLSIGHVKFTNIPYQLTYFIILISHLMTSVVALPMIFVTYSFGVFGYLSDHKRFAKITFFLWEYVSITGVLIVLMLKFLNN
ncbi:MAG: putative membrane protein [Bacteriovoracaceae bacterium]|jgi:putative membrane protein